MQCVQISLIGICMGNGSLCGFCLKGPLGTMILCCSLHDSCFQVGSFCPVIDRSWHYEHITVVWSTCVLPELRQSDILL